MTREKIFQTIKQNTLEILPNLSHQEVTIQKRLKDLGANSVDRMEIITMTLEALEIKVPLIDLGQATNIEGLVDILYKKNQKIYKPQFSNI